MNKILLLLIVVLSSCTTVSKIEEGKYALLCSGAISLDSCKENAEEYCPNGYNVISIDDKWSFYTGAMNRVYVSCKSNRTPASVSSTSKLNCSEKEIDIGAAEAKGYKVEKRGEYYYLSNDQKSFMLSEDKKHVCKFN